MTETCTQCGKYWQTTSIYTDTAGVVWIVYTCCCKGRKLLVENQR